LKTEHVYPIVQLVDVGFRK